jgi:hypothetical protein
LHNKGKLSDKDYRSYLSEYASDLSQIMSHYSQLWENQQKDVPGTPGTFDQVDKERATQKFEQALKRISPANVE